jgi:uncharacterized protein
MSLLEQLQSDVKDAMRARDSERTQNLRLLVAALQKVSKEKLRDLDEAEEIQVLNRERKQRIEAAEAFEQGGADDRAAAERSQAALIEQYLPEQMDEAELARLVDEAVAETGASSPKEMGAVMKALMPKVAGRADGKAVSAAVQARLRG